MLEAQRRKDTSDFPVISILVPVYNTPMKYMRELVESVQAQTCPRWQLCIADASDEAHREVGEYLERLSREDGRIRYAKVENKGIAANTNAAEELAEGEYLALADHDDLLAPHAI